METFPRKLRFWTAATMVLCMSALDVLPAMAGLAPSQTSGATAIASARDADLLAARRALENKVVAQKLRDYGIAPEDVQIRLASMSDQDLHTLASASRGLPSGGDGLGTLIGVAIFVILVIVILKLLNKEVIVK
jgi:hypothetical protein